MMRIKVVEILKFIVAVAIGFTIRVMFENSYNASSLEKPCDNTKFPISDLSLDNIHEQLRQPHQPSSIRDIIEYRYFNSSVVFDTHLGNIKTQMKQYHRSDIRDIIRQVESLINAGVNNRYKMKNFVNGFERIDPVRGKEYVIDIELIPESPSTTELKTRIVRYSLVKPFSYAQMVLHTDVSPISSTILNMLYVVNGSHAHFIKYILAHHETSVIGLFPVNVTIYLCSAIPSSQNIRLEVDAFANKHKSLSSYAVNLVINDSCVFQAAEVVNAVVRSIGRHNVKIVLLDINVNVTYQFLQRCSSVLIESLDNVYIPIPFARFLHKSSTSGIDELSEGSGVWDHDNYEVLCIHKKLFDEAKGLNTEEVSTQAYKSIINSLISNKKQIFRSTDPSVSVFYHNIKCTDQESMRYSAKSHCEGRQRRTFQSQLDSLNSIKLE